MDSRIRRWPPENLDSQLGTMLVRIQHSPPKGLTCVTSMSLASEGDKRSATTEQGMVRNSMLTGWNRQPSFSYGKQSRLFISITEALIKNLKK